MEPTSLVDNLSSDYMAALSSLLPRQEPNRVLVYVESDEDISFWNNILSRFNQISFDIQLPIKNALEKGKQAVLDRAQQAGPFLILCVDSDYDYFLQQTTEQSRSINNNPFVFQTYAYSIENLFCFSESLHSLCVQSTKNNNSLINIDNLIELYSQIIYKLFIWSVYFNIKQDFTSFNLKDFCDTVKILSNSDLSNHYKASLEDLDKRVTNKILLLENQFPNDKEDVLSLENELEILGLKAENTYLFAQGHLIKDNVVLMFLNPICSELRKEKICEIKTNANHGIEIEQQINHYKKQSIPIETVLRSNTEYKSCFLYTKIYDDLSQYVENLNIA
jgi:hypothetical protein